MKFFQKVNMSDNQADIRTGIYRVSGTDTIVYPGDVVVTGDLAFNTTYQSYYTTSGSVRDQNSFVLAAPSAVTAKNVYIVDPVEANTYTDSAHSNTIRSGVQTLGTPCPAGVKTRIRNICRMNEQFILGAGNFNANSGSANNYAVLTAGSTVWSGSAAVSASGLVIQLDQAVNVSQGISITDGAGFLCHVVQLP